MCSASIAAFVRHCAASIPTFRRNVEAAIFPSRRFARGFPLRLPQLELPALALTGGGAIVALPSGETRALSAAEARDVLASGDVLTCHALFVAQRLSARLIKPVLDVLELFAFARPGEPCLPSPLGLARALALKEPGTPEESARGLHEAATALFDRLVALPSDQKDRARKTAAFMNKAGWRWGPFVLAVLGEPERLAAPLAGLDSWRRLPEWEDEPPSAPPGSQSVEPPEPHPRLPPLLAPPGATPL